MTILPSYDRLHRFFLLTGLWVVLQVTTFNTPAQYAGFALALWTLATTLTYTFFYLLPAVLSGYLVRWLLAWRGGVRVGRFILPAVLVGMTGLTQTLLFADRVIYGMYGFHINGFVADLVFTPGGIDSLGASLGTQLTAALIVFALLAVQATTYAWVIYRRAATRPLPRGLRAHWLLLALLCLTVSERVAYGYSSVVNYQPILFASQHYPLYLPLSMRKLAARMGIDESDDASTGVHYKAGQLNYPQKPLHIEPPARPMNIVWLVAESLRYDMLDPAIMPKLWDFSQQSLRLEQHFSGGNTTQMGVFSMFYGLYANYWFPMLDARRTPLLMDVLQQQNYQFNLRTSQRFTYPAFDKTIFGKMNPADMHPHSGGVPASQRDTENIDELLKFVDQRDTARPFMGYMFFESTHANYDFPADGVIAKPYVEDFNYLTADFAGQIGKIKNRYINAAHHVDKQIGRVIAHLREKKLLDNTVIIVLGDHGEEFMERGRWGHSAEFNRFQTSTPGVLWVPGNKPRVISGISSHLDIPATLMPLLGVRNPPADYSLGQNLLAPDFHRDYAVAGDWNRIAYLGEKLKVAFPVNASGAVRDEITDGDDRPISDRAQATREIRPAMVEMMHNLKRFSSPRG
jgi:membrane-anchored protein YejM (alkaline phosphatase superfamily)